ncbi:glycerol-3-phosphate 1-O-acyltransferase PlsY [Hippea maritima]|uniref:Glycerol-3-phosphate acyltransferase n=1 Tax=Hippea maritima (strain ATCC 700847 / DSM 10411 / MH2) TaxID=760142 RepID=F2LW11_HIPMA|nr:glycerol-3-phosphate 1-O-acyltransferase PlsY [Hippea maritima]AEA33945.1 Glycerol-3-phosphate acyltransferase [Hippea maritima DSM 10411]
MTEYLITGLGSFLIGSIPFGWLIAKSKGIDVKKKGSGNIGATNVYRVVGKKEGALTLILDLLKGFLAVVLFSLIYKHDAYVPYVSSISVVLGHDFSIFLKFKGGKGVATTYGAGLIIYPTASMVGMAMWIAILLGSKYSSLAALLSFTVSTLIALNSNNYMVRIVFVVLLGLMIIRHRDNIVRLFSKRENKINI